MQEPAVKRYDRAAEDVGNRRRRALDIVFQSSRRYTYLGVPEKTYDAMKAAFSKGEFFNRHIRDRFAFERTSEEPQSRGSRRAGTET